VSPITGQSLMGTLSGLNPQTLSEALIEQQRSELASNVARALEEAQGAGQEYQEAAAAPPPQLEPGAEFLPALFGNIASVLAQTPEYRQRAQEGIQQQKAMLLQTRAQNLQALRDVYQQKAEAAQRLGDMETQEKARVKHEQISKLYDQILDSQRQQGALELERERQKGRKEETSQEHAARLAEIVARGVQERETMGAKPAKAPAERASIRIPDFSRLPLPSGRSAGGLRSPSEEIRRAATKPSTPPWTSPFSAKTETGLPSRWFAAWF